MADILAGGRRNIQRDAHSSVSMDEVVRVMKDVARTNVDVVAAIRDLRIDMNDLKTFFDSKFQSEQIIQTKCREEVDSGPIFKRRERSGELIATEALSLQLQNEHSGLDDESNAFVATTLPLAWPSSLLPRKIKSRQMEISGDVFHPNLILEEHTRHSQLSCDSAEIFIDFMNSRYVDYQSSTYLKSLKKNLFAVVDRAPTVAFVPFSLHQQMFEMLGLVILLVDFIIIPFSVSFQGLHGIIYCHLISLVYWSVHMLKSFSTGYYSTSGEVVLGMSEVVYNYLTSWFLVDSVVLALDCWGIYLSFVWSSTSWICLVALVRCSKINMLARFTTRFAETTSCDDFFRQRIPESLIFLAGEMWLLFAFLFASHLLSCLWYSIGTFAPSDTGSRWTEATTIGRGDALLYYSEMDLGYQYSVCFLWGVSQITLAGNEIVPQNSIERWVSSACVIYGFLFASALVSLLSASMVEYRMCKKDIKQKLKALRQYLVENRVVDKVAIMITMQATRGLSRRERLVEKDVLVLDVLSSQALRELRSAVRLPHFERYALFRLCSHLDTKLVQHMCSRAVDIAVWSQTDDIFLAGHQAISMYYLISGRVTYSQEAKTSPATKETRINVECGTWLAEAALWSMWIHVGTAQTDDGCCLLKVSPVDVFELVQQNLLVFNIFHNYSEQFQKHLHSAKPPRASWPNDLKVPFCDYCDIVVSMPTNLQIVIGLDALRQASSKSKKLRQEVNSAKSLVVLNGNGEIFRVVSLVALEVIRNGGECFVQIGKQEGGSVVPSCQLPGGKLEADETASDAVDRILAVKLRLLQNKLRFVHSTRTDTEKESREYGVRTRYFRTTFTMELSQGQRLEAPFCHARPYIPKGSNHDVARNPHRRRVAKHSHLNFSDILVLELAIRSKKVVCVFKSDDPSSTDAALYAWLSQDEFDYLCSAVGEQFSKAWLDSLELPPRGDLDQASVARGSCMSSVASEYSAHESVVLDRFERDRTEAESRPSSTKDVII